MEKKDIRELFNKYQNGQSTPEEEQIIDSWYDKIDIQKNKDYSEARIKKDRDEEWEKLPVHIPIKKLWPNLPKVAAVIFLLASYFLYTNRQQKTEVSVTKSIPPAGNKAVLILSNGQQIDLSGAKAGKLSIQSGVQITKTASGQLVYTLLKNTNPTAIAQKNTIKVPNGGHYQLNLPDGSRIFLNAASTLTYPSSFNGLKERSVTLDGEAYFEVAKNRAKPFKVKTGDQEVEVLGTHFNINGYKDEAEIRTTLLEGSVKVKSASSPAALLKPGQQSVVGEKGKFNITTADTVQAVAWKNGDFQFDQDLRSVMREISRWYNVEIIYQKDIPENLILFGWVSRRSDLDSVLATIEKLGGVHFKVNERRVTVMK